MKTRTKWFLGALLGASVIASAISGEAGLFVRIALLYVLAWVAWRGFIFLALLFKPLRDKLRPHVDPINAHMHNALRRSKLGPVADFSEHLQAGIDRAVDDAQRGLDTHHNK